MSFDSLAEQLEQIDGVAVERQMSSASLCTYRVGGPIALFVRVERLGAISDVASAIAASRVPTLPVGKGSNLLVADSGFAGVGLMLGDDFTRITIDDELVRVGAAAALPVIARATVSAGRTGFEWAVGVPGTMGGAVRMNAGGHGSDMAASLVSVTIADLASGTVFTKGVSELELGYRRSNIGSHELVTEATLALDPAADSEHGSAELKEIVSWRRANQPGGANAGSVFTNPPGDSAGRLIDAAGLKGMRVGTASVSDKHANFIQADPDGSADDVMALMVEIVDRVAAEFGVVLHAETRLVGFAHKFMEHVQGAPASEGDYEHG